MAERIYAVLGGQVRKRREDLEMTQAELSARIGLSRASVANIEGGRQAVLLHQFLSLADALEVPPADLLASIHSTGTRTDLPDGVQRFMATLAGTKRHST